jgi:hypothetical protein
MSELYLSGLVNFRVVDNYPQTGFPESWPGNAIHAVKRRCHLRGSAQTVQSNFGPIQG